MPMMQAEPAHRPPSRAILLVAGYLLWVSLSFAIEGAARRHCYVPSQAWIEAGANPQQRLLRRFSYDKSVECLNASEWYSYSTGALFAVALLTPFVVIGIFAERILRLALRLPFDGLTMAAMMYSLAFIAVLALSLGPFGVAQEFYDRHGVGRLPMIRLDQPPAAPLAE